MPGPSNGKKKPKQKQRKTANAKETESVTAVADAAKMTIDSRVVREVEEALLQRPFIDDPGNGPRVRDAKLFLNSFFAQPVSVEDELCKEFAQKEILEMLMTVLLEETALIVWYNKSRLVSRVCPACQRLYRIGDMLQDMDGNWRSVSARQRREQEMSGLCSAVCFAIASYLHPGAVRGGWGQTAEEMEASVWDALNDEPVGSDSNNHKARTLGLVVKMTRLGDLGLGQLLLNLAYE